MYYVYWFDCLCKFLLYLIIIIYIIIFSYIVFNFLFFFFVLYFFLFFFFSSRRRHTRYIGDWSSDVCSSDLSARCSGAPASSPEEARPVDQGGAEVAPPTGSVDGLAAALAGPAPRGGRDAQDRKSTRLNSSHRCISYAVFCLKKKKQKEDMPI